MSELVFPAFRFDGRRAEVLSVVLRIEDGILVVETASGVDLDRERLDRLAISDPLDHAPRLLQLESGVSLEVPDAEKGFAHALVRAGLRSPPAVRLQGWWPGVLIALAALVAALLLLYLRGVPALARRVAFAMPPALEARMGEELLAVLDAHYLASSRLDETRRAGIAGRFQLGSALVAPGVPFRLEFRTTRREPQRFDNEGHDVNALALPGGIIVLLDGLVEFAGAEDAVLAVLGHELGHVVDKHSTRHIFESLGVGTIAGLLWGDFSSLAASVTAVFGMLQYSRDFEREADEFALRFLRAQGLSVQPLRDFFLRLKDLEARFGVDTVPGFLSTHPSTNDRIERMQDEVGGRPPDGPP